MNKPIFLIRSKKTSAVLEEMIDYATEGFEISRIPNGIVLPDLRGVKLLLAAELDASGYCLDLFETVNQLLLRGEDALEGSEAVLLLRSKNQFHTKSTAQSLIFNLNRAGCRFPGHPLVEAIEDYRNFKTWQKHLDKPLREICLTKSRELVRKLADFEPARKETPRIVALHASSRETSNTLMLWHLIKEGLEGMEVEELHVESGHVVDCRGCSFKTCLHYGSQNSCYYGGVITNTILPAIKAADVLVWICPNYNDAVSAKLMAIINRMTVIYRTAAFDQKQHFAVVVSGNSGGDSVARQLIGGLTLNKNMQLPPRFVLSAIANDPGAIMEVPGIRESAAAFADHMRKTICGEA